MVNRLVTLVLVIGLLPTSVYAQSRTETLTEQAERLALEQQRPAARGRNPYRTPAFVLMGIGGACGFRKF